MGYQIQELFNIGQASVLKSNVPYCFTYIFMFYRNVFELLEYLRISPLKWDMSQPYQMFKIREIMHKSRRYQISRYQIIHYFKFLKYDNPILFGFYLGFPILYRKVCVLKTELWIPAFKWIMSQPQSSTVLAREIKQKLRRIFLWTPCINFTLFLN